MIIKENVVIGQDNQFEIPEGYQLLCFRNQFPGQIDIGQIWIDIKPGGQSVRVSIKLYGTGHVPDLGYTYIGTDIFAEGGLVWHAYYKEL